MTSAVRASTSGHRSPNVIDTPQIIMTGEYGNSLFENTEDNIVADVEVRNINSFYSPIDGSPQSNSPNYDIGNPNFSIPDRQDQKEENLRKKCAFYFMNPIQKFIARYFLSHLTFFLFILACFNSI